MSSSHPAISVVIATYNRAHLLGRALRALCDEQIEFPVEVIVVDNNSSDDTKDVVASCQRDVSGPMSLRYLFEPNQGTSAAKNTGVRDARSGIVAFLDDDAVPSSAWLSNTKTFFDENSDVSAVGGPIDPEFEISRPAWLSAELESYYSILDLGETPIPFPKNRYPFGASMAFRREVLGDDPFPTHVGRRGNLLLSMEETVVFKFVLAAGGQIYYHPGMRVKHFVAKERLSKTWVLDRLYFQGLSKAIAEPGLVQKAILLGKSCFRLLPRNIRIWLLPERDAFLDECYLKLAQGSYDGLIGKTSQLHKVS